MLHKETIIARFCETVLDPECQGERQVFAYRKLMLELVADIRDVLVSLKEEDDKWNKETK